MITRFAPSPTGPLHLGHAYSAVMAFDLARKNSGEFLLRIEDIDRSRARAEWEAQIYDDLAWLGLSWSEPVMRQSERIPVYQEKIKWLWESNCLFSCTCTRRDVVNALAAPQEGADLPVGPDGFIYPGTCRGKHPRSGQFAILENTILRLDITAATTSHARHGRAFSFIETGHGPHGETGCIEFSAQDAIETIGDIVLARRDTGTSYHLAVVVDDAAQGVTHVVRGQDLFEATKIHVILQNLLGLPTPVYHHHALIRDDVGKRLAKRDDARAIALFRAEGASPADIRSMVGL